MKKTKALLALLATAFLMVFYQSELFARTWKGSDAGSDWGPGAPTPSNDKELQVSIAGVSEATVSCEPSIFTAEVQGGTEPYTIVWNPSGSGLQMGLSFRSEGAQTIYCKVTDSSNPKQTADSTHNVTVHPRYEVKDPSISYEEGDLTRGTDEIRGDPTGQPVNISLSVPVTEKASISTTITFEISIVEVKIGYKDGDSITITASYAYSPDLRPDQSASIWYTPMDEIKMGTLLCRNCEGVYEEGSYTGKQLDYFLYQLIITDRPTH